MIAHGAPGGGAFAVLGADDLAVGPGQAAFEGVGLGVVVAGDVHEVGKAGVVNAGALGLVDGDGDGKIDLWFSVPDALASTANVISAAGWKFGKPWGFEVSLPKNFAYEDSDLDHTMTVATWTKRGVKTIAGGELAVSDEAASVYLPAGAGGPAFLVFPNFKSILKYNNAASYALAVCLLADQLKGAPAVVASWPRNQVPLNRDERMALQAALAKLGFDIGKIDGLLGSKARAALRAWQKAHALSADGYATEDLLTRVAIEAQRKAP